MFRWNLTYARPRKCPTMLYGHKLSVALDFGWHTLEHSNYQMTFYGFKLFLSPPTSNVHLHIEHNTKTYYYYHPTIGINSRANHRPIWSHTRAVYSYKVTMYIKARSHSLLRAYRGWITAKNFCPWSRRCWTLWGRDKDAIQPYFTRR